MVLSIVLTSAIAVSGFAQSDGNATGTDGALDPRARSAMLQYYVLLESLDYYPQFVWGEETFVRYLLMLFSLEQSPFRPGDGVVWESKRGGMTTRIDRALIGTEPGGDSWWRLAVAGDQQQIEMEVRTAATGVPLEIRYLNPQTGWIHSREPALALGYEDAAATASEAELQNAVAEMISDDIGRIESWALSDPREIGERTVQTPAGAYDATVYVDELGGGSIEYWLDFEIPGSLLGMTMTGVDGNEVMEVRCVELTESNTSQYADADILPDSSIAMFDDEEFSEPAESEGTPDMPVVLEAGGVYDGSVEEGGTSFYAVHVLKRCDIVVTLEGARGATELYYYADDPTYVDWVTSASGYEPDIEDYFTDSGSLLYFAVEDVPEGDGLGETYMIDVAVEYILDPIGINIRGEIYEGAEAVSPGSSLERRLGTEALHYFATEMDRDGTLTVIAKGLPEGAGLRWYDSDGSYSSAYWTAENGAERIEVDGLTEGETCYYYVVGEPGSDYADAVFSIEVATE